MGKREFVPCGDGNCQFGNRCQNYRSDECYVCMFNTSSTPRDYFRPKNPEDTMDEKEQDMIEN